MDLNRLKSSLRGEAYRDLKEFLILHLEDMKNIDNVKEYSKAQDQAVEMRGQIKAYKKIKRILEQIIELGDSQEKPGSKKNDYGV